MAPASEPVARRRDALTLGAASVMVAFTFFILITGGGQISLGGLTLSAHDWRRPASLAAVLLIVGGVRARRAWARSTWLDRAAADAALFTLATITLVMNSLWWFYLVKACGGLDSHGYVSAAELLTTGHLSVTQPIAAWLPFPGAIDAATPLGWVPALAGPESVPRYPLGLPLVMALFREIGGAGAVFYVSPVLASATLVLTYFIVRRAGGVLDAQDQHVAVARGRARDLLDCARGVLADARAGVAGGIRPRRRDGDADATGAGTGRHRARGRRKARPATR